MSRPKTARLFLERLESRVAPSFGLSTLALFNGTNGANSWAGLIMDSSGNLYGTTTGGGASGDGTVFELAHGSGTITTLASFNGTNGADPAASLIMDSSGNLYGTTNGGGASDIGTVFELAHGSGTITTLAWFNDAGPNSALIMDSSGNLYGTTNGGGASDIGTVFELAHGSGTITTLASFNGTDGSGPGALIVDSSGNLYGTTDQGGPTWNPGNGVYADGTVFELAKGSGTITTLASFNGTNGSRGGSPLVMDSSGNLYGTTFLGGPSGDGNVFKLAKGSRTITNLASFNGTDGFYPTGVIMDSSGNLYGTTYLGGPTYTPSGSSVGEGTVFELAHGSRMITRLASFNGSNGAYPEAGLIMDSSGNFYGTTSVGADGTPDVGYGDGTVFELLPHTPALNWNTPAAISYGTALSSTQLDASAADSVTGAAVAGTFVYTPPAGTILHVGFQTLSVTFTPTDTTDYSPITTSVALLVDPAKPVLTWNTPAPIPSGTPLSSTQLDATAANPNNGSAVSGTFAYTPPAGTVLPRGSTALSVTFTPSDTTDYTTATASAIVAVTPLDSLSTLAAFGAAPDGANPIAGVIMDSSGNLYGTTVSGGASNDGTVFELAHGSGTITTLASFNGADGYSPYAGLIMDSSGNLYGTTVYGGASGDGTVFELAHGSGTITTLASFNGTNGESPYGGVIMDSSGNLYGTTYGDKYDEPASTFYGTVFDLAHGSGTITTLASFNPLSFADRGAINPWGALIMDSSGNLYGTTRYGGDGDAGAVFEWVHGASTITTVDSLGGSPLAGLIMDGSGNLYGTTDFGGTNGDGTVFEVGPPIKSGHGAGSRPITVLASFNGANGANPIGGLIMDSSGNLYGTTAYGGGSSRGTVFELPHGSSTITTLVTFNGSNGAAPEASLIMDSSGNLYGTTESGGASNAGTVFEVPGAVATPALRIIGSPSSRSAGAAQTFTVTLQDAGGTTGTGFIGTVNFTSTDGSPVLPANDTFTAPDNGTLTFTKFVLQEKSKRSLTATDTRVRSIAGNLSVEVS